MLNYFDESAKSAAAWEMLTKAKMWVQEERYHSDGFIWVSKLVEHFSELEFPRDFTRTDRRHGVDYAANPR